MGYINPVGFIFTREDIDMTIKATWDNIELTDKGSNVNNDLKVWEACGWLPKQLIEHGLARVTQPTFINGAKYFIHPLTDLGYPFNGVPFTYDINTNRFNDSKGAWFSADSFGTRFNVELVTMGPTPLEVSTPALYERVKKALGERDVPIGGEDHLVGQVTVDHQKAVILDKVIKEFKIPVGGDVIKWLHNRTETVEKAARQLVLNSFEYQGPNYDISLVNKTFNELVGVLGIECKYDMSSPDHKPDTSDRATPRNKYDREISPGVHVDVYDVLAAFTTNSAAIDHAVKKLLAPGQRGVKDRVTDLKEAVSSIQREIDRIGEWSDRAAGGQIPKGVTGVVGEDGLTNKKGANGEDVQTEFLKSDYVTHHNDWREACQIALNQSDNDADKTYWLKQLNTLTRLRKDYGEWSTGEDDKQ